MRTQKSSEARLRKLHARSPRRRRPGRTADLERAANEAVIKLEKRILREDMHPTRGGVLYAGARQIASEVLRSMTRKYGYREGTDEFRHVRSCLLEKADLMTGNHRPRTYDI